MEKFTQPVKLNRTSSMFQAPSRLASRGTPLDMPLTTLTLVSSQHQSEEQAKLAAKMLVHNNFAVLANHAKSVKKEAEFTNGKTQTIRLISQIQYDLHEQDDKTHQKKDVLGDFKAKTDANITSMIYKKKYVPREEAWRVKHAIDKSLRTKLYHAEIVNPKAKKPQP